ncbi:MAG: hypothetical protein WBA23_16815, partial [Tunicatimonas sp.]|uniref:hypothetical protein n=1 Tax=Tunicatimonas sp. TaxID=1940096 RepID=UPI003C761ECC
MNASLATFIVRTRLEVWRRQLSEDMFVGLYLLQLTFLLLYSAGIGYIINKDSQSVGWATTFHLAFLFGYYWLISIFPLYNRQKTHLFNLTHPVDIRNKYLLELLYNLLDLYLLLLLLVHFSVVIIVRDFSLAYNLQALSILLL